MNRGARIFMYFSFALIDFVFFRGVGIHALGLVFLVLGIWQLAAKPKLN